MAQELTDVLTLEKEGLVGFTENGEQVPLTHVLTRPIPQSDKELIIKILGDNEYAFFKEINEKKLSYSLYERRT